MTHTMPERPLLQNGTIHRTPKEHILRKCQKQAVKLGFQNVSIFSAGNALRTPGFLTTYPEEWNSRYISERYYLVDPVVNAGRIEPGPMVWGGKDYLHKTVREGRQMLMEARRYGIRSAFSVPFFCADGRFNLITLSSDLNRKDFDHMLAKSEADAIQMSLYTHLSLARLDLAVAEDVFKLTPRQKSCLRLVLDGRTNAEMADLLAISEATIRFHLTGAVRQTNARNSVHAAFMAHQLSLL